MWSDIIRTYDLSKTFFVTDGKLNIFGKLAAIALVILFIRIVLAIVYKILRKMITSNVKGVSPGKYKTITSVTGNTVKYILYLVGMIQIMDIIGFKSSSLLTIAGFGGMALGFGAQSVVKDIISGLFILMDNQFQVGDSVTIDGYSGEVVELGMRTTKIKDYNGNIHMMSNGNIKVVTNLSKCDQRAMAVVKVPNTLELDVIEEMVEKVSQDIVTVNRNITKVPSLLGVTGMNSITMNVNIIAWTKPGSQWEVERRIYRMMLDELNKRNIKVETRLNIEE